MSLYLPQTSLLTRPHFLTPRSQSCAHLRTTSLRVVEEGARVSRDAASLCRVQWQMQSGGDGLISLLDAPENHERREISSSGVELGSCPSFYPMQWSTQCRACVSVYNFADGSHTIETTQLRAKEVFARSRVRRPLSMRRLGRRGWLLYYGFAVGSVSVQPTQLTPYAREKQPPTA